jgi:hypothetical protein
MKWDLDEKSFCKYAVFLRRAVVITTPVCRENGLHDRARYGVHVLADVEMAAREEFVLDGTSRWLLAGPKRRTLAGHGGTADVEFRAEYLMLPARCRW